VNDKNFLAHNNGLIISALGSNCGKTTITAMLLAALTQRHIKIQPYKIGADIFDPGMHCRYSNEISLNLDSWIMHPDNIINIIKKLPTGYRGIAEGWEGIFECNSPDSKQSTTMEIAHLLNWPIILVICCQQVDNIDFDEIDIYIQQAGKYQQVNRIAGIILNKVTDQEFADKLIQHLNKKGIKTLGCIRELKQLEHPVEIHNAAQECNYHCPSPEKLAAIAEQYLDIDAILTLTTSVLDIPAPTIIQTSTKNKKRIAISHDDAFFFYYKDNSEFLKQHNVEIIEFSPLKDKQLPENLHGLILSGGIPEKYAQQLTTNLSLRQDIKNKIDNGLLCYAECGGLMFLCQGIYMYEMDEQQFYPMIGCIPGIVEFTTKLQNFGYTLCQTQINNQSLSIRGHEYHYANWLEEKKSANLWKTTNCHSKLSRIEGYKTSNIHASFIHLYFPTAKQLICDFFNLD